MPDSGGGDVVVVMRRYSERRRGDDWLTTYARDGVILCNRSGTELLGDSAV